MAENSEFGLPPRPEKTIEAVDESTPNKEPKKPKKLAKVWKVRGVIGSGVVALGGVGVWLYNKKRFERVLKEAKEEVSGGAGNEPVQVIQNQYADFDFRQIGNIGLERTGIDLKNLSNPKKLIGKPFLRMAAKFGDDFLVPPVIGADGRVVQEVSEAVVSNWVNGLNLNPTEAANFRQNYVFYRTHPQEFGQFLLQYGASPTVVNFLSKAEELKTQDSDLNTWYGGPGNPSDRYERLQQWLQENTTIAIGKIEQEGKSKFNELAGIVDMETGGAVEQMLGPLETLPNMSINTTAMHEAVAVDMAEFYQHELQKPHLANTGLPLILTGLFLLRVGSAWPREVIAKADKNLKDIYYWFKLGQHERAIRDLAVLGKQAWERVTGKKD